MATATGTLRIALVSSTFPPYEGGVGNVCYYTAKGLAALGHDVTVFVPGRRESVPSGAPSPFRVVRLRPWLTLGNASLVPSLARTLRGFDIIELFYPFFGGDFFVWFAARRHRIPYVLSYHVDIHGNTLARKLFFWLYGVMTRRLVVGGAAKVLALSKNHIEQSQIKGLVRAAGKVAVIPNGVDPEVLTPKTPEAEIRRRLQIAAGQPVVAFNAVLDRAHFFKRLDVLMKALAQLPPSIVLLVIGDGDLRHAYERQARELGISERVRFLGNVPNSMIADYLQISTVLALISDIESFGIVLIEAMACGKPVVVSDLPGVRAIVEDGVNGLFCKPRDVQDVAEKLRRLLDRPDIAREMGQRGRQMVERLFTWKKVINQLDSTYRDVIHESTHR